MSRRKLYKFQCCICFIIKISPVILIVLVVNEKIKGNRNINRESASKEMKAEYEENEEENEKECKEMKAEYELVKKQKTNIMYKVMKNIENKQEEIEEENEKTNARKNTQEENEETNASKNTQKENEEKNALKKTQEENKETDASKNTQEENEERYASKKHKKKKCSSIKPEENVIFLKTHKTGSSTVTNVLQRFARSRNLKVALPKTDHRFCYPRKFQSSFVYKHYFNNKFNMLFNHAVFHKENMLSIMENKKAKMVTIIREPFSQFDSISDYFNFRKFYNLNNQTPVMDSFFIKSNDELKRTVLSLNPLNDTHGAFSLAKNPNSFDLGFDVWNETSEYMESVIKSINQDFHLVMIMEYMEESFVLLKNELCWNLEDLIFHVHNARKKKVKYTNDSDKTRKRVYSWNKMDAEVYSFFNKTFWEKVKNGGNDFEADVQKLKIMNREINEQCFNQSSNINAKNILKYLTMDREDKTRNDFIKLEHVRCIEILANEIDFTKWFKLFL